MLDRRKFCQTAILLPGMLTSATASEIARLKASKPKKQRSAEAQRKKDFFSSNVVHDIWLEMDSAAWKRLGDNFLLNDYYPCALRWNGVWAPNAAVRSRGSQSRNPQKPSLRFDLNRLTDKSEFPRVTAFSLNNAVRDASMLKDWLAMRFFRHAGLAVPRRSFARLNVNGEYWGLYVVAEEVNRPFLKKNFKSSGGYLYKYRPGNPAGFETLEGESLFASFRPNTHKKHPKTAPVEELLRAFRSSGPMDFPRAVGEHLDVKQFLKHAALEAFVDDRDGILGDHGMNGFFLYRPKGKKPARSVPWGKDTTFLSANRSIWQNTERNPLIQRALENPDLRELYRNELARAAELAGATGGWLEDRLLRRYGSIRSSALTDTRKPSSNQAFEEAVNQCLEFIRRRAEVVKNQLTSAA